MRIRYAFLLVILFCPQVLASHHGWAPVEAFSNADGTLQFVEMTTAGNGENQLTAAKLDSTDLGTNAFKQYTFTDLATTATGGRRLLIATSGFEAAFGIAPDYVIPDNFLTITAGDVWYNSTLTWSDGLPTDGWQSYNSGGLVQAATPTNFAGATVTLTEPAEATATTATQFLMTWSGSANVSTLHVVNTADGEQSFTGTLYNGDGEQQGGADVALHVNPVASNGRLRLSASDLETLFSIEPWSGPAVLEVSGTDSFALMGKLVSPSGLVSNTNCVRENRVLNLEGQDSSDRTFIRLINTSDTTINNITGTLYNSAGDVVGSGSAEIRSSLAPRQSVWVNRQQFEDIFGAAWDGEALLELDEKAGLKLLNLNFVNDETFFNFSCFETSESSDVYLMTTSTSANISNLHIVNTWSGAQSFTGTLYSGDGEQLGSADQPLHTAAVASKGRLILTAENLESIFSISPWSGPALLDVNGTDDFELMIKLESPSGLISNTNCVRRDQVHNIEGSDSADLTFIRCLM